MSEGLVLGLRLIGSLIVVVGLAVLVTRFLLPRLLAAAGRRGNGDLEVLEVRPIDRQHKVVLLRVAGRRVLAACGPGGVARLDAWEDPDEDPSRLPTSRDDVATEAPRARLRSLP